MDDFEAYGLLREHAAAAGLPAPAEPRALPHGKRSHWLRNTLLVVSAYLLAAIATTLQPLPLPLTSARLAVPFPGGAPLLFGLPDRPFTVLVVGLDRRPNEAGASRTDTILLLRIDPGGHDGAFLSIPRDALMEIPRGDGSFRSDRVNTAFVYNYSSDDPGAAPRALAATIEHNLGIAIDHYVIFDQRSAQALIDAMGGVTIDNPREFGQDDYSDDDVNVVPQHFPEGKLTLNGYEAVAYGRIREGSSDFDRILRQQRVGSALIDRASSPLSVFRLPSAFSHYRSTVHTDMSWRQSAGVLSMLKRVPDDELKTKSLGDAAVSCASCDASIQLLDPTKTQQIIAEAFGDDDAGARAFELLVAAGVTP